MANLVPINGRHPDLLLGTILDYAFREQLIGPALIVRVIYVEG